MKKNLLLWMLLFLALCQVTICAMPVSNVSDGHSSLAYPSYRVEQFCNPQDSLNVELPGLTLHADSGSVIEAFTLSAERLPSTDAVAPMPSGMVNVTTGRAIYRLLPHGEHFIEPATLTMEYDPILLPHGYKPKDIHTCYYDTLAGRWIQLPRVKVDTLTHTIASLTTHFTDFANAIIKVPEMPETKAFVPTMMQDLPDIDPLDQIPMIAVPEANNNGTAELTYPIFIPQGRNGMQPSLALTYSSSNTGNGPLGVGWSLNMPAITIDTRWGVPRYNPEKETEEYTLNGQPLVMHEDNGEAIPLPHQTDHFELSTKMTRRFYFRDTRMQDKIIRHGQNPAEYWWSVTDRQGITTYYGGIFDPDHPEQVGLDTTSVLKDANGSIGYWAITAVVDLYGNYITYTYQKDGNNLYPVTIEYTGNYKEPLPPTYAVNLVWNDRSDITSDARLGFLRETRKRLCQIGYSYNQTPVRLYALEYESAQWNTQFKSRLRQIAQVDSIESSLFIHSDFWYGCVNWDQIMMNGWPGFKTQFTYNDTPNPSSTFANPTLYSNASNRIGSNISTSWDVGGTLDVGLGFDVPMTTISLGGNYSYSRSDGRMTSLMMDLNGDGLPDQVYEENGHVWYKRQIYGNAFAAPYQIPGLTGLSHEVSETNAWGLQADILVYNVSGGWPVTDSYTDMYFADVNGDGLPDMVTPQGIRFNSLNSSGNPTFTDLLDTRTYSQNSASIAVHGSTCGKITLNGEVDERITCQLRADTTFISYQEIMGDDYDEKDWSDEDFNGGAIPNWTYMPQNANTYYVTAEDGFYQIIIDTIRCEREPVNPDIEAVRVWVAPEDGPIHLSGTIRLEPDNSPSHQQSRFADGVTCFIQKSSGVTFSGREVATSTDAIIARKAILDGDSTFYTISANAIVNKGDVLMFRVYSGDNSAFDRVRWVQQINYAQLGGSSYNSAVDYICVGEKDFVAPDAGAIRASIVCNNADATSIMLHLRHSRGSTLLKDTNITVSAGLVDSLVYLHNNILAQDEIAIWLIGSTTTTWSNVHVLPRVNFTSSSINQGSRVITYTPDLHIHGISKPSPYSVPLPPVYPGYPKDKLQTLFGGYLHRGWGQFAYNWTASPTPNDSVIHLVGLYNSTDSTMAMVQADTLAYRNKIDATLQGMDSAHIHNFSSDSLANRIEQNGLFNPLTESPWIQMSSDSRSELYIAYGHMGAIGQYLQSNTRQTDCLLAFNDTLYQSHTTPDIVTYDSPFPMIGENGRLITIRKSSRTKQDNLSAGASIAFYGLGASNSTGDQNVITDYTDLNGDGFPDFIGSDNAIQYSTPWGGIGETRATLPHAYSNHTESYGTTFSGSPSQMEKQVTNGQTGGSYTIRECQGNISGSVASNTGTSFANYSYVDLNGDGLPDMVDASAHQVAYNLGYSFAQPVSISSLIAVNNGRSNCNSVSGSLAFSVAQVSISGGANASRSNDNATHMLIDINGDGLPDLLQQDIFTNAVSVSFNLGGSFTSPWSINLPAISANASDNYGFNLGITGGFSILGIVKFCLGVQSTPWSQSDGHTDGELIDMNGDGYPDWLYRTGNGLAVRFHKGGKTNLMQSFTNPTGQKVMLDYTLSEPSQWHRQRQWNLTQVTDSDRLNPNPELVELVTEIEYTYPHYDNYERTDYGYSEVITYTGDKNLIEHYHNDAYILHGRKKDDILKNQNNEPVIGHRYYIGFSPNQDLEQVYNEQEVLEVCDDANLVVHEQGDWTDWYEGQNDIQLSMLMQSFYDSLYNLTRFVHHGNYALPGDEWTQNVAYSIQPDHRRHHLISLPIVERVTGGSETLRLSEADYNHYGSIERIRMHDTIANMTLNTYLKYDSLGHLINVAQPSGYSIDISYEHDVETYPEYVINSFNETTYTTYDVRRGRPLVTQDPAGSKIFYNYDSIGRLISVRAPAEDYAGMPHTVEYIRRFRGENLATGINPHFDEQYDFSHLIKIMHSAYNPLKPDSELVIFDARGHELQRKRRMAVGANVYWINNGYTIYDRFYRPIEQYYPCQNNTAYLYQYDYSTGTNPTLTQYDALDRPLSIEYPDHALEYRSYSVLNNALRTLLTDANGHTQEVYKSPQDWTLRTREGTDSMTIYQYNPIGEVIRVTDAEGYRTNYTYDMFGHTTMRTHPDNGTTRWIYDNSGLLEHLQTQRLFNNNQSIDYTYNHGRLTDITTPNSASVHYDYDAAGRVSKRWDASGTEEFLYDELGNVSRSVRRIAVPTESSVYLFKTDYQYDSYGRMLRINYPDGEEVEYHYGIGGQLADLVSSLYDTICIRQYDERGQRVYQKHGNGVVTTYQYSADRSWLTEIDMNSSSVSSNKQYTFDAVGNVSSIYIYEYAGSTIANWTGTFTYDNRNRLIGASGPYHYTVNYSPTGKLFRKSFDNLPTGAVSPPTGLIYGYDADSLTHQPRVLYDTVSQSSLQLFWDADGNLAQIEDCKSGKTRLHRWNDFDRLIFSLGHDFCGYYGYDADGIRTYKLTGTCNSSLLNGAKPMAQAIFDDVVLYPNPFVVVTPRGYTNHYYAGSERIASRIGEECWKTKPFDDFSELKPEWEALELFQGLSDEEYPFGTADDWNSSKIENITPYVEYIKDVQYQCGPIELPEVEVLYRGNELVDVMDCKFGCQGEDVVYYYHPDHLGSTSWVTNFRGDEQQFIAYMPYGEPLLDITFDKYDCRYGQDDARYKFTGKERDAETGYDYVEQRYYWWPGGFWLRPDPLLDKYLNLSPYAYCNGNPLKYVDPTGEGPNDRIILAQELVEQNISYDQELSYYLRTATSPEALATMDCSEFVCRVMAGDGITPTIESHNTKELLTILGDETQYIKSEMPQAGDIVLWNGHTGIVENFNEKDNKVTVLHATRYEKEDGTIVSGTRRENYSLRYYKGKNASFYRPVNETPDVFETSSTNKLPEIVVEPTIED